MLKFLIIMLLTFNLKASTEKLMTEFYKSYFDLVKLNQSKNLDQKNQDVFLKSIQSFIKNKKASTEIKNSPTLEINYNQLISHLEKINQNVKDKNYEVAKKQINNLSSYCLACHLQVKENKHFINLKAEKEFNNLFEYADYLYLTRHFAQSKIYYENAIKKTIEENPNTIINQIEIINSLRKILSIEVRTYGNINSSINFLNKYATNYKKIFAPNFLNTINKWIQELSSISKSLDKQSNINAESYIYKILDPELNKNADEINEMVMLYGTGVMIRELLFNKDNENTSMFYYYLGKSELNLEQNYFKSNAPQYFNLCIKKNTNPNFVEKCYIELENYTKQIFNANSIDPIPTFDRDALLNLKLDFYE